MIYKFLDKVKIAAYAVGSAAATGTTAYGATAAVDIDNPYLVASVITIAAVLGSLHTAISKLKQIKKDQAKKEREGEQHDDQERLISQLTSLKPQMEKLLSEKEQEETAQTSQNKNGAIPVSLDMSPDAQAANVARARKERAAQDRQQAKEWRQKRLKQLEDALIQLDRNLASPSSPTSVQNKSSTEKTEIKPTNALEKIVRIGAGFGSGFAKVGAATFGFIKAGAALGKKTVELFSPAMVAPVVVLGVVGGLENAYQANQEHAKELQEEEQHNKYQARKRALQKEYDDIISLLELLNSSKKPVKEKERRDTPLPGVVVTTMPAAAAKSDDSDSQAQEKHTEKLSIKVISCETPVAQHTAIASRPKTPSSGVPKSPKRPETPSLGALKPPKQKRNAGRLPALPIGRPQTAILFGRAVAPKAPLTPFHANGSARPTTSPAS